MHSGSAAQAAHTGLCAVFHSSMRDVCTWKVTKRVSCFSGGILVVLQILEIKLDCRILSAAVLARNCWGKDYIGRQRADSDQLSEGFNIEIRFESPLTNHHHNILGYQNDPMSCRMETGVPNTGNRAHPQPRLPELNKECVENRPYSQAILGNHHSIFACTCRMRIMIYAITISLFKLFERLFVNQ